LRRCCEARAGGACTRDRSGKILSQRLGRGRRLVNQRGIAFYPERYSSVRILILRDCCSVQNGVYRHFDIVAEVWIQIQTLVVLLGRSAEIAIEAHHVGNVVRIGDDTANELGVLSVGLLRSCHVALPILPVEAAMRSRKNSMGPLIQILFAHALVKE
jgi:hypothetical protein